jgi:glyoxylase-like metal-dependent hydrolase (beta-lactamase superfamily II)
MIRMRKAITTMSASCTTALALALALAGCKKGEEKKPQPDKPAVAEVKDPPPPPAPTAAEVHAYTASENGFLVSSYAVVDNGEILLVDSQLIQPEVEKFIEMVKGLSGKVTTIYITHPHADHYLGLEWLSAAFPEAKVVASPATAEEIKATGEGTLAFLKSKDFFGGALAPVLAAKVVVPEPHAGDTIKIGGTELKILTFPEAESTSAHTLFDSTTGSLFMGDLAYNNVHAWLKDTPPDKWIAALEELKKLPIKKVYPGHGEPGGPEILDQTLAYLQDFKAAVAATKSQTQLVKAVKDKHPDKRLPVIVEMAAPSYHKKK